MSEQLRFVISALAIAISIASITLTTQAERRERAARRRREDAKKDVKQNVFEIRNRYGDLIGVMRGEGTK